MNYYIFFVFCVKYTLEVLTLLISYATKWKSWYISLINLLSLYIKGYINSIKFIYNIFFYSKIVYDTFLKQNNADVSVYVIIKVNESFDEICLINPTFYTKSYSNNL